MRALLNDFAAWVGGTLRAGEVATDARALEGPNALAADVRAAAELSERAAGRAQKNVTDEARQVGARAYDSPGSDESQTDL